MKSTWWFLILFGIIALPLAWYLLSPLFIVTEMDEVSPIESSSSVMKGEALFQASAHEVSGTALLIDTNGEEVLRFEDFQTINGPDLRVYLAADLDAEDYIDLGELKATKGNINYALPKDVDLSKYKYVLIWCRAFSVLFSYAELPSE